MIETLAYGRMGDCVFAFSAAFAPFNPPYKTFLGPY